MQNFASRSFFAGAGFLLAVASVYSLTTADYSGAVLMLMAVAGLVGVGSACLTATGAAERFSGTQEFSASDTKPSIAPFAAALGVGVIGLGAALGLSTLVAGMVVLAIGATLWFISSWRSHPDHVGAITSRVSDRFSLPWGMPLSMLGLIIGIAFAISRSLLAASKIGSIFVIAIAAITIFAGGFLAAARPSKKGLMQTLIVFAAVSVAAMFIVGEVAGSRDFEKHHGEQHSEKGESEAEGGAEK
jgi:hypothetical protein